MPSLITPNSDIIYRKENETYDDYFVRLYEHKKDYDLNCVKIAELLNSECGKQYGESAYRKEYAAFNRGRQYERNRKMSKVRNRILCISDTHVPFQLPVDTFSDYAGVTDTLVLNGDISDCQAISRFPKVYRVDPMEEIIQTRTYLIELIELIQPKKVVVVEGNHDVRFEAYIAKALDNSLVELMPRSSLEWIFVDGFNHYNKQLKTKTHYEPLANVFDNIEIDYAANWFCVLGKTIFCHPLAFNGGIMKTAEKAVQYFRNESYIFSTLVMAHTHRLGEYKQGKTTMYEQGCCCDVTKQHYANGRLVPSQKEGFLYLCQDENGEEIRDLTRLVSLN